ncbi:MAG: alpha/beta hydrolase [Anaerolineae bacterium]|nr:alpha/beta hydrolase [Anaerolineae bacterium]
MMTDVSGVTPSETTAPHQPVRRKRGVLFWTRRVLKYLVIGLVVVVLLGVVYQTVATAIDKRNFPPPGQLFNVDGRQMHIHCMGAGNPTVILEAGGFSFSVEWYWVQRQLAQTTRVCAYDRAGTGWSESSPTPRSGVQIARELRTLLAEAGIPGPYVLVGHSLGGILTRIYASQYPDDVIGIALVDTAFLRPRSFHDQGEFDQWKAQNDLLQAFLWALVRTGVLRFVIGGEIQAMGYPPDIAAAFTALKSTNQSFDTYYAEAIPARWELGEQSIAAENLGALPLMVLWADHPEVLEMPAEDQEIFKAIQQDVAAYSSNSAVRTIAGSDHGSIIGNEQYAQQVSDAILDVMEAAQTGDPLTR